MKRLPLILVITVLAVAAVLVFIRNNRSEKFQIVTLSGTNSYAKISATGMQLLVGNNSNGVSALPLFDNDLMVLGVSEETRFYKYSVKDGSNLNFRFESFKMYLNDRLISLTISKDPGCIDFLKALTPEETRDLRHLQIVDSLTGPLIEGLKKLAGLKPDLGFVFDTKPIFANEILNLFNPSWLAGSFELSDSGCEKLYSLTGLVLLYCDPGTLDLKRLPELKKLKTLILICSDIDMVDNQLVLPPQITSVTLMESNIHNLGFLRSAKKLQEVSLVRCDSLMDISIPEGLTKITRIGFPGCKNIVEMAKLNNMPIEVISFPSSITDPELSRFIGAHKKLKLVELLDCDSTLNLEPLRNLPELSCLSIVGKGYSLEKVYGFKKLDYLSFPLELPNDSLKMKELTARLPNTTIVPSAGLCLGSGWLLLVVPLLLFIPAVMKIRKKKIRA